MSKLPQYSQSQDDQSATQPLLGSANERSPASKSSGVRHYAHDSSNRNVYSTFQTPTVANARTKTKQPNRTTKTSQKLKLFPEDGNQTLLMPEEFDADVYSQLAKIPHGSAKVEAEKISKMNKDELSRVTAYCTSSAYLMDQLIKYLKARKSTNGCAPKRFDECLYTTYASNYPLLPPRSDDTGSNIQREQPVLPEIFLFDYGVVVFWGMTLAEEQRILKDLEPYEEAKLDLNDIEVEEFHYYYDEGCQPRIYNDIITLRHPSNYLVKLTIAHAIAQSVKMTLFERLIDDTINETKYIPQVMAESGNIRMSRTAITKKIGQLFIMRINVNLVSNILDTPEIFWSEPALEPLYSAIRGYLEISQRVELLNQRVEVISDLLEMLKDHLNSSHGEHLEWIVIWLIAMEIVVAVITTCLDAFSLSHD
ncbi:hypothetical protein BDB00DRAFT_772023 [Zychaea mexicana]|uniref:uncharacterized protein n=1 Tax=Zychaea mexicana TaxID=64656 RepID=UPI0022FE680A|nr:uncharacterized protein BDB00DRAFT_772023 [Zychaea mexicana]KAI9488673.1 hypothetical protein BDB00DRAFT_772023 [Zychaea mexicana]